MEVGIWLQNKAKFENLKCSFVDPKSDETNSHFEKYLPLFEIKLLHILMQTSSDT